ncbi:hypothetical protein J3F83DRAFT_620360 [Trichoderma novae-zelandiae]
MPSDHGGSIFIDVCLAQREEPGRLAGVSPASSPFSRKYLEAGSYLRSPRWRKHGGNGAVGSTVVQRTDEHVHAESLRKELPGGLHPVYRRLCWPTQDMLRSTSTGGLGPGTYVSGLRLALKLPVQVRSMLARETLACVGRSQTCHYY